MINQVEAIPYKLSFYQEERKDTCFNIVDNYINNYRLNENKTIFVVTACFNHFFESDIDFLSKSERKHAISIKDSVNYSRFIASRAFIRRAIGYVLGSPSYTGEFLVNQCGKPYLPTPNSAVHFNMSHTRHHLAAVFILNESIGIDIEMDSRAAQPNLLEYVFSPKETEQILTSRDWKATFLRGWTYKEAVLKCIGTGFTRDPKSISVSFKENQTYLKAYALSIDGAIEGHYRLIPFTLLENTIGTIAIQEKISSFL